MEPIDPISSHAPEDVPTQPVPVVTDAYQPLGVQAPTPPALPLRRPPRPAPTSLWPEFSQPTPPPPPARSLQRRPAPRALIVAMVGVIGILLLLLLRVYVGGASAPSGGAPAITNGQQGTPASATATPVPTSTVAPTDTAVAATPPVLTTPPAVVATRPPAPTNTPRPRPPVVIPPTPTPKPPATPVATLVGPTPPLTVRFTCGAAVNHQLSHICVAAAPGATLSLNLYYRCDGQKALTGAAYLGASSAYMWSWTPDAPCTGTVLAVVNASWPGYSTSAIASFPLS